MAHFIVYKQAYVTVKYDYSGASLSDCSVERQNRLATEFLRSQKWSLCDGPYGVFSLCDDRREAIMAKRPFFNSWSAVLKWPPGKQNGRPLCFLTLEAPKMAAPMEDLHLKG